MLSKDLYWLHASFETTVSFNVLIRSDLLIFYFLFVNFYSNFFNLSLWVFSSLFDVLISDSIIFFIYFVYCYNIYGYYYVICNVSIILFKLAEVLLNSYNLKFSSGFFSISYFLKFFSFLLFSSISLLVCVLTTATNYWWDLSRN